jgi:5-methyltetrahydrofolate--homocysteine methyltransferase
LRQENSIFSIGERCNANGSKAWRQAQEAQDWEACVGMAKEQMQEGSNALDICTAFVGRDEAYEMCAVLPKLPRPSPRPW